MPLFEKEFRKTAVEDFLKTLGPHGQETLFEVSQSWAHVASQSRILKEFKGFSVLFFLRTICILKVF